MPFNPDISFLKNSSCCFFYADMYECVQHAIDGVNEHGDEALEFIAKDLLFDDLRKNGDEVTSPISKSILLSFPKIGEHFFMKVSKTKITTLPIMRKQG